ncbi:MAG: MotA/TolQ/ExbB proton channel family protein [Candidatus Coatesbacteria bacterium]|nr:MotA/TolQ/ExbB proton channel family protein [Candidatus Coatesbacteria bacterium]
MPKEHAQRGLIRFFYVGRMDANLGVCGLLGLGFTAIFYYVFPIPLLGSDNYIHKLFVERGWVQYAITFLFFWGASMLLAKYVGMRMEKKYLMTDPVAKVHEDAFGPESARQIASDLSELWEASRATVLPNRIARMLGQFASTAEPESMQGVLREESEIDEAQLASSYVMTKVFVWAIPILGFIGTVIGIVQAVAGFSDFVDASVADISQIKSGLGLVTSGLSVAFETTLLALVVSLIMMIPMSALQKAEENLLSDFDRYCIDNVITKAVKRRIETPTPESAILAKVLEMSMRNQLDILEQFKSSLISSLSGECERFSATVFGFTDSQEKSLLEFARLAESMTSRFDELRAMSKEMTEATTSVATTASERIAEAYKQNVGALAKEREAAQEQISGLIKALEKTAADGASAMESLGVGFEAKVNAFINAVDEQKKATELLNAANKNLELLTSTKELISVLESVRQQLAQLKPAVDKLSRPRSIHLIDEQKEA